MEGLPDEIILEVLSRLPIQSLVLSKAVCRAWRRIIQDPVLINKHLSRMADDQNDPSFILQIQNQLYHGDFCGDHHQNDHGEDQALITKKLSMPPLLNFHLVGSCNGLLCLRTSHPSFGISIYNPFTRDYTELPIHTKYPAYVGVVVGFGVAPTTKEFKVVQISYKQTGICGGGRPFHVITRSARHRAQVASSTPIETGVHILTLGSSTWRKLGSSPFHFIGQRRSQVLVNGKLHWVSYPNRNRAENLIVSFDLANEQFQEVPRPDCISLGGRFDQLVALRGCLSVAFYHDEGLEIWVMKEYDVKESWVKEFNINGYLPKILLPQDNGVDSLNNSRFHWLKRCMRIICQLRCGKMVLEYINKALVLYDPHCGTFEDLQITFEGITSRCFKVAVYVASLNWTNT